MNLVLKYKGHFFIVLVILIHLFGLIGLTTVYRDAIIQVTPAHLLILSAVLLANTAIQKSSIKWFLVICLLGGWIVEAAGVHSQLIFGPYTYGETLGIKVLDVPLIIGLNWFMLSYCLLCSTNFVKDINSRAIVVAMGMTAFDLIMEPAAVRLQFWTWHTETGVPVQNYLAWFLFSWVLAFAGLSLKIKFENKFAPLILTCLTAFFILLDILLYI